MKFKSFFWDSTKNEWLKKNRDISFEKIVLNILDDGILDILEHHNQEKYPGQKIMVLKIEDYIWLIPFHEIEEGYFLVTAFPSRKEQKKRSK